MTTARQIDAYRKRLAKRTDPTDLTFECIGAVIAFTDETGRQHVGTLTGFRCSIGYGLLGPVAKVDVTICTRCVGGPSGKPCKDDLPVTAYGPIRLVRNETGAAEAAVA